MELNVKLKLTRGMPVPEYATDGSAAVDLRAALEEGEVLTLRPGERVRIPTGLALAPETVGVVAVIAARSGLAFKNGITMANGIGVIDADYRGEISVCLRNGGDEAFEIRRGDRIAQMFFLPVYHANFLLCDQLDDTERGAGGFGSTGVQ